MKFFFEQKHHDVLMHVIQYYIVYVNTTALLHKVT